MSYILSRPIGGFIISFAALSAALLPSPALADDDEAIAETIIVQAGREHDGALQFLVSRQVGDNRAEPGSDSHCNFLKAFGGKADAIQCARLHVLVTDLWRQSSISMTLPSWATVRTRFTWP